MSLLECRKLSKHFRLGSRGEVRALDEVSLTIDPGSFSVLAGPSGSGKTTLLALLGALDRPTSGQVLFEGRDLARCSDVELARVRRRFGFIFQHFALIPSLPVWENITYPLIPRGISRPDRLRTAQELLARLALPDKLSMSPRELSGGEQQRVAIARALAGQPAVLFADEPTSNLDPGTSQALLSILKEIHGQGKTVVVASHDPSLLALATSVYELEAGKLQGRPSDP